MSVHVMLDLETWGTAPGCALRSIGACTFDPYVTDGIPMFEDGGMSAFYANIDRQSCEDYGLTIDPKTEEWWARQSQAARDALLTDPQAVESVVVEFHAWWRRVGAQFVWSNGANFDEPIWCAVSRLMGLSVPWKFWNVRDTRTIWDVAGIDPKNVPRDGVAHNAYADARHQAKCVTLAYGKLGLTRFTPLTADTPLSNPAESI